MWTASLILNITIIPLAYSIEERYDDAVNDYKKAVEIDPDDPFSYYFLPGGS